MNSSEILNDQIALQIEDKYLLKILGSDGKKEVMELFIREDVYYTRPAFLPAAKIPRAVGEDLVKRYSIILNTDVRIFEFDTKATKAEFLRKYWHRDRETDEFTNRHETKTLTDYIADNFHGSQREFAAAQGVQPAQVTQWLNKSFVVVNDTLCSPRRALK